MPAYEKYHSWYALTYAKGTLGIGCIRFKHGRIRRSRSMLKNAQKFSIKNVQSLSMLKHFVRIRTYGLYDKPTPGTR
jgi:hypothetical protein